MNLTYTKAVLILFLAVATYGVGTSQTGNELSKFQIYVEVTNDGIKLTGKEGCAFKELFFTIGQNRTQAIDQYGMITVERHQSTTEGKLANFLFTVKKTDNGVRFVGIEGVGWSKESFDCTDGNCGEFYIDQNAVTRQPDSKVDEQSCQALPFIVNQTLCNSMVQKAIFELSGRKMYPMYIVYPKPNGMERMRMESFVHDSSTLNKDDFSGSKSVLEVVSLKYEPLQRTYKVKCQYNKETSISVSASMNEECTKATIKSVLIDTRKGNMPGVSFRKEATYSNSKDNIIINQ